MSTPRIQKKNSKFKPILLPQQQDFSIEYFAKRNLFQFSNDEQFQDLYDLEVNKKINPQPISPVKILKDKLNTSMFTAKDHHTPRKSADLDNHRYKSKSTQLTKPNYIRLEELAKSTHQMPRIKSNSIDMKANISVCIIQKQKALNLSNYVLLGSMVDFNIEKINSPKLENKVHYHKKRMVHNKRLMIKKNQQEVQNSYLLNRKINQYSAKPQSPQKVFDARLLNKNRNKNINQIQSILSSYCQAY